MSFPKVQSALRVSASIEFDHPGFQSRAVVTWDVCSMEIGPFPQRELWVLEPTSPPSYLGGGSSFPQRNAARTTLKNSWAPHLGPGPLSPTEWCGHWTPRRPSQRVPSLSPEKAALAKELASSFERAA